MTSSPAKEITEVSGDLKGDKQYPTPGLDDDLLHKFSQEHVWNGIACLLR